MGNPLNKKEIAKTTLIFLIAYIVFLIFWIKVKDPYGYAVTFTASKAVAGFKNVTFDRLRQKNDDIEAIFDLSRKKVGIKLKTSPYIFNAPLTFGIMAALFIYIKRKKRAYSEALLMLLFVHFIYVMTYEIKLLTDALMRMGIEAVSHRKQFIYQFLWVFTENMLIRFEPFLIGFYLFMRFKK